MAAQQSAGQHAAASWLPCLNPAIAAGCTFRNQALLNERMAPEILQYKEELVERVKAGLKRQVGVLRF